MKRLLLILALATALPCLQSCSSSPSERVSQVQTLKFVGTTAKATMDGATDLLKAGTITYVQWEKVAVAYDNKFQPAYRVAVAAVQFDTNAPASPETLTLLNELIALVNSFKSPAP